MAWPCCKIKIVLYTHTHTHTHTVDNISHYLKAVRRSFVSLAADAMSKTLTFHSHQQPSQPPPASAGPWPASPERGPTPPPPAGSCGSKMPHRPPPTATRRGKGGERVRERDRGHRSEVSQETCSCHEREDRPTELHVGIQPYSMKSLTF